MREQKNRKSNEGHWVEPPNQLQLLVGNLQYGYSQQFFFPNVPILDGLSCYGVGGFGNFIANYHALSSLKSISSSNDSASCAPSLAKSPPKYLHLTRIMGSSFPLQANLSYIFVLSLILVVQGLLP